MRITDGLRFNDKHSYHDYGMYLSAPPDFGSPEPKITRVDIPGRDGELDFTEATGEVKYNNRECTFQFATMIPADKRDELMDEIRNDIHGKDVTIVYDLDPEWYYTGRATVVFEDVMSWKMRVVITVSAFPYKLAEDFAFFEVNPEEFESETIFLGKGTAAQNINSIFEFGTKNLPQLDLTQFTELIFKWENSEPWGTPALQIVDGDGVTFDCDLPDDQIGTATVTDGIVTYVIPISDITTITKSRVWRILCQGRRFVELYAETTSSTSIIIPVDRMTVVPVWTCSASCTVLVNGRKFTLYSGAQQDNNIRLKQGDNQVSFITDADEQSISIQFRNGRL